MKDAAKILIKECLGVKKTEEVLIIVDEKSRSIGEALFKAVKDLEAEAVLVEMIERESHGNEPPRLVAEAMKIADVVIAPTSKSLSHTKARLEANKFGTRVASMPTITEEIMSRTISADYSKIKERSIKYRDLLSQGCEARLRTRSGTDMTFSLDKRQAIADTGILHDKGAMGNLPAGEAFISPLEGKSSGIIVIDGSMAGVGGIKSPIIMTVKEGYVVAIDGGAEAAALSDLLKDKGPEVYNIAELGIGTNEKATISGNPLEDEKVMGTVHVALGDSITIGGKVKAAVHLDGIMKNPTLIIDGKTVIKNGNHLI